MQLVKVYSNKESFKTVEFNKNGLNFIVAKQKNLDNQNKGDTYNGVGKSLLVRIIHFCFGASDKHYKSFCKELDEWEFYIDFIVKNNKYTVKRCTKTPKEIYLNDEKLSVAKFNEKMAKICFSIPKEINYLTFRSLFPFFIRPNKEAYANYDIPIKDLKKYQIVLYNAFLLGLDIFLVQKKKELKSEKDKVKQLIKNFKKDSILREFFIGEKDIELTLLDIEEQIQKLDENLKLFKVAKDYNDVQVEADEVENKLFKINNELILIENNIKKIEKSLGVNSEVRAMDIESIYNEINIHFSKDLTKTLNELEEFHNKLTVNRKRRLIEQKGKLLIEKDKKQKISNQLQKKLDSLMKYLGEHEALDVFVVLSDKKSKLEAQREDLTKYKQLEEKCKLREMEIVKEQSNMTIKAEEYLNLISEEIATLRDFFRTLAKKFYPNVASGLSIENDNGDNQNRFKIQAKIDSDASDGINSVRIFCYDLTVLLKGHNHYIDFIFHDSRLFDGIDERQKADIFNIAYELFDENLNKQYIATINQNQLEEVKNQLGADKYKTIIEDNTVLILTDESANDKILGVSVDISEE